MPYVTSFERIGEARGEARGEVRGQARVVLSLLAEVCGSLPAEDKDRVRDLSPEELDNLAKALLRFQTLADLQSWFDKGGPVHG